MHIYYKNFNLNSNHILTEYLKHLKVREEYDTKFFGEGFVFMRGGINPLSTEIDPCWSRSELVEDDKEGIDLSRLGIDPCCKFEEG